MVEVGVIRFGKLREGHGRFSSFGAGEGTSLRQKAEAAAEPKVARPHEEKNFQVKTCFSASWGHAQKMIHKRKDVK
jgi:hypothetical protein